MKYHLDLNWVRGMFKKNVIEVGQGSTILFFPAQSQGLHIEIRRTVWVQNNPGGGLKFSTITVLGCG